MSDSRIGRSILAVVGGIVVGIVLTLITDIVLHAIGFYPPIGQPVSSPALVVATVYRVIYSVIGSYIVARLAPSRPMGHALISGVIGVIVSTIGPVVTWNKGAQYGPHWYPVALIILSMPTAWVGGKLFLAKAGSKMARGVAA